MIVAPGELVEVVHAHRLGVGAFALPEPRLRVAVRPAHVGLSLNLQVTGLFLAVRCFSTPSGGAGPTWWVRPQLPGYAVIYPVRPVIHLVNWSAYDPQVPIGTDPPGGSTPGIP